MEPMYGKFIFINIKIFKDKNHTTENYLKVHGENQRHGIQSVGVVYEIRVSSPPKRPSEWFFRF